MQLPTWMPSENQIAQCSHFFIATTIVFGVALLDLPVVLRPLAVLAWALPKEFIFDLIIERDSVKDSTEDFEWYVIGAIAAIISLYCLGK